MGICVFKHQQTLTDLLSKQPDYHTDKFKNKFKSIKIWKITNQTQQPLLWPFNFLSTCSYILIISSRKTNNPQILSLESTSIELSQMIFGAQFLIQHLKLNKKLMLNNQQYTLDTYSFYGDSVEDQLLTRSKLTYFIHKIQNLMEFGAGSLCLEMLNSGEPVVLNTQLKQTIDFNSEHFAESKEHPFFKQQLFGEKKSMKQCFNYVKTNVFLPNFSHGANKLPQIDIKPIKPTKKIEGKPLQSQKSLDQSLPFACQITQINLKQNRKTSKVQAGNINQQNILFDDLGIQTSISDTPKYQQFLKGLFLSSESLSKNYSFITNHQIKLIVNCAPSLCKNWFINDISYKWIDMPQPNTSKQFNIQCLIYQVADIVGKCLAESAGVLIHCQGTTKGQFGGSRSAGIMVGVLMTLMSLKYQQGLEMVSKKMKTKLPTFMQTQLKQLSKKTNRTKTYSIYQIGSYSQNFPKHLVAKYLTQIQNLNNLQGITNYEKSTYLCISPGGSGGKIMIGRQCLYKQQYQKYAKQHFKLLTKYQSVTGTCTIENIDKGFRKQPKIQIKQSVLHINLQNSKTPGFLKNQQIVLKYPILRPIWQKKKPDGFYYTIRQKKQSAQILMNKGTQWIGYQNDKQQFFDRIINSYLGHIPHDQIFIIENQQEQSIFDASQINL